MKSTLTYHHYFGSTILLVLFASRIVYSIHPLYKQRAIRFDPFLFVSLITSSTHIQLYVMLAEKHQSE